MLEFSNQRKAVDKTSKKTSLLMYFFIFILLLLLVIPQFEQNRLYCNVVQVFVSRAKVFISNVQWLENHCTNAVI